MRLICTLPAGAGHEVRFKSRQSRINVFELGFVLLINCTTLVLVRTIVECSVLFAQGIVLFQQRRDRVELRQELLGVLLQLFELFVQRIDLTLHIGVLYIQLGLVLQELRTQKKISLARVLKFHSPGRRPASMSTPRS